MYNQQAIFYFLTRSYYSFKYAIWYYTVTILLTSVGILHDILYLLSCLHLWCIDNLQKNIHVCNDAYFHFFVYWHHNHYNSNWDVLKQGFKKIGINKSSTAWWKKLRKIRFNSICSLTSGQCSITLILNRTNNKCNINQWCTCCIYDIIFVYTVLI